MGSTQDPESALHSSLNEAGIHNLISSSPAWAENTTQYQKRLKPDPACIAFPEDNDQLSKCLKCARENSVKVSALGPGHSFQGLGFGSPGNLVINMEAFNSMHYDEDTELLTYGGGTRVGPVAKYLWDTAGRHFPHVRGSNVGVTGSSIGCGYGTTSRFLGTPMDNIVAVEFMLYDGSVVVAEEGSDLLWAAKGAAASFGIILSVTTKTYKPVRAAFVCLARLLIKMLRNSRKLSLSIFRLAMLTLTRQRRLSSRFRIAAPVTSVRMN